LRVFLRESSLSNKDKANRKTGAHQAGKLFQDDPFSVTAVIRAVGSPWAQGDQQDCGDT
jgi:hypothetical protein